MTNEDLLTRCSRHTKDLFRSLTCRKALESLCMEHIPRVSLSYAWASQVVKSRDWPLDSLHFPSLASPLNGETINGLNG